MPRTVQDLELKLIRLEVAYRIRAAKAENSGKADYKLHCQMEADRCKEKLRFLGVKQ